MWDEIGIQAKQSKGGRVVVVNGEELVLEFVDEGEAELHQELEPSPQEALKVLEEVLEGEDVYTQAHEPLLTVGGGVNKILFQVLSNLTVSLSKKINVNKIEFSDTLGSNTVASS
jgi:hypothetical protein